MIFAEIQENLKAQFPGVELVCSSFSDNNRVEVPSYEAFRILKYLKDVLHFDMLADLSAVDYLHFPGKPHRYGVWYALLNTTDSSRVIVKTFLDDPDPVITSVFELWKGSDWMEREVYDMYGIQFEGHPDLRRILLPDEFTAFPLRKDYPLRGLGERHNFQPLVRSKA